MRSAKNPKGLKNWKSQNFSVDSKGFKKIRSNSERTQKIRSFSKVFKDSRNFQKFPKNFQTFPNVSKRFQNFQKFSKISEKIRKNKKPVPNKHVHFCLLVPLINESFCAESGRHIWRWRSHTHYTALGTFTDCGQ